MRELLSLSTVKFLAAITALVAVIAIAVSLPLLANTSSNSAESIHDLHTTIEEQDQELRCRDHDAANIDVLRAEITLELSVGLVQVVREDEDALQATVERIELLQVALEDAIEQRRTSVRRCR